MGLASALALNVAPPREGGGAPPPFAPTDVPGLRCWPRKGGTRYQESTRTTLVTAAGQEIGSWTDASANALHPTSAGAAKPLEPAGRDGADFDGATSLMVTPNLAAYAGDFFVGMVITPTSLPGGFVRFLERVPIGDGVYLGTAGSGNELIAFVCGAMSASVPMSVAKHAIAVERRGTLGRLYLDGVLVHTWSVPATAIPDAPTVVGGPDGSGALFPGTIHEVVIATLSAGATGATEVTNLLSYLATV